MLRNADISYSSITANQRNSCSCCFCSCHCNVKSFCRNCFLRLPYGTITSTLFAVSGLLISIVTILHSTNIADRLAHDLLRRKFYWLSDLKVWYIVLAIFIILIITINLIIGFATTGRSGTNKGRSNAPCRACGCTRASTTTFIIKSTFVINYILFYFILILAFIVFTTLFICYVLTTLCNEGTRIIPINYQENNLNFNLQASHHYIDLRQFSPLLSLRSNETEYLYFKDDRLKRLCGDYISALTFYIILCSVGMTLVCIGFVNFIINLSVNWARTSTKQKYAELMYLNGAEMTAFNDGDPTSRY